FSTRGGTITVDRDPLQQNRFLVKVPNMPAFGAVQVTAYGGNHIATVYNWLSTGGSLHAYVDLFDTGGNPVNDRPFAFHYRVGGNQDRREAYLWAEQPTAASYAVNSGTAYVSTGGVPTITRVSTGRYRVTLPGLAATGERGNVQVTPQSNTPLHARVEGWTSIGSDLQVNVRCVDQAGLPRDGRFFLGYEERAASIDESRGTGAHVWADNATSASYAPNPDFVDSNGTMGPRNSERITRTGIGQYRVHLPTLAPSGSTNAQVTPYGAAFAHATVRAWTSDGHSGTYVYVDTFDIAGNRIDAKFTLSYLTDRPNSEVAWAWVSNSTLSPGATFTPSSYYQYTSSGVDITVQRSSGYPNQYLVRIPRTGPYDGVPHVSAYGGNHVVMIRGWLHSGDETIITVEEFTAAGAPAPSLLPFTILYLRPADANARIGWRVGNHPTAPTNPPPSNYGWNGNRGAPTVTHVATGLYRVFFPGLAQIGTSFGNLQVSAAGFVGPLRAQASNQAYVGGGVEFYVRIFDIAGAATDGWFTASYHDGAMPMPVRMGSGAYLYASSPTATFPYAPTTGYHFNNGTLGPASADSIHRLGSGSYEIILPNLAPWLSSTVKVSSAPIASAGFPTIVNWGPASGGGTRILVRTYDRTGVQVDGAFTLLYITDRPAVGTPATNTAYGAGCHGAVLTPLTRPVLGTDWDLSLVSVPAGATLAAIALGFANPNLPFGAQAPGCWQLTSGQASIVVPLPAPVPAYSMTIPQSPSLIGFELFAQGAAMVPNLNPLWLATSNGARGSIGDV
ncbi:MAG: hypothetical protein KDC98_16645, partial [Planctomycetes bacterium]|nr:hypothetical protein [Planctomycetota bacterium]